MNREQATEVDGGGARFVTSNYRIMQRDEVAVNKATLEKRNSYGEGILLPVKLCDFPRFASQVTTTCEL